MTDKICTFTDNYDEAALRQKRIKLLLQIWEILIENSQIKKDDFKISTPLLNEVVEHYLSDVRIIKCRYNIEDKIQLHKIAGLMTSLIMRYRPVIPIKDNFENTQSFIYANEIFAVTHGLAICGEYSLDKCEEIGNEPWFDDWLKDFLYLLHCRNYSPESLIFIYQTLSYFKFQKNFNVNDL